MKFGNEYCDKCGQNARACECDGSALKLARAQADYETAVAAKADADKAVNDAYRKVAAARERVDQAKREAAAQIPVNREQKTLSDGSPVTDDHRDLKSNGQQKGYVVLSDAERARGFVRPVRRTYVHVKCGAATTMGQSIAETYARDPQFYGGTFCVACGAHFPLLVHEPGNPKSDADGNLRQFEWDDGSGVGS